GRPRRGAFHGRRHRGLGLRPRVLRAAGRGDDRGRDPARAQPRDVDTTRRADDVRHGAAVARREDPSRRAARGGHVAGRHDDPGNPRAGTGRRARRVLECDSSCNGEIARARVGRAVKGRDVELVILEDENEVATVVANRLARAAQEGGNVVLTGGKTPKRADEQAAKTEADWSKVALWWGDERCVPPDDDNSNYGMAKQSLLDNL